MRTSWSPVGTKLMTRVSGQEPQFCGSSAIPQVSVLQGPLMSWEGGNQEAPLLETERNRSSAARWE